jgi:uncharacterized RDD family membrane protein YckC
MLRVSWHANSLLYRQGIVPMDANLARHNLGTGVYYARHDYAGLARRMVIIVIDFGVIVLAGITILVSWAVFLPHGPDVVPALLWVVYGYLYLTLLRGSQLRTLGYVLTGAKLVNLKGATPSFFWMNMRLFSWFMGPYTPLVDLLLCWGDEHRQMLRDKLAGTYVVRKAAVPVGTGPIGATTLFLCGSAFVYPEVIKS